MLLDLLLGGGLVVDHEAEMMQSGPVRTAFAAVRAFRKVQQRQVHHAVGQ
jgi:hypothetical protein